MSEKERMLAGELYIAQDEELAADNRQIGRASCRERV